MNIKSFSVSRLFKRARLASKPVETSDKISKAPFFRGYSSPVAPAVVDPLAAIDQKRRFAYFRIFKAANSTVVATLYNATKSRRVDNLQDLQVVKDTEYTRLSELSTTEVAALRAEYFTFTFVRNPYTRLLSCYLDKIVREASNKTNQVNRKIGKPEGSHVSLEEFLTYLEAGGLYANAHWAPQVDLIPLPISDLRFIGKVEHLEEDLRYVLSAILGVKADVVSAREHATSADNDVRELALQVRRRIYRLYEKDFVLLGYAEE